MFIQVMFHFKLNMTFFTLELFLFCFLDFGSILDRLSMDFGVLWVPSGSLGDALGSPGVGSLGSSLYSMPLFLKIIIVQPLGPPPRHFYYMNGDL